MPVLFILILFDDCLRRREAGYLVYMCLEFFNPNATEYSKI